MHETLCYSPNVLADSYIVPQCRAEPRSLGALMALYEGNFIKLIALAPALKLPGARSPGAGSQQAASISRTAHDLDLHLCVDAVTRYTIDLRLTYLFEEADGLAADPDLRTERGDHERREPEREDRTGRSAGPAEREGDRGDEQRHA